MSKNSDINCGRDSSSSSESNVDKSFVRKVKSRVSGFIPSSLSKWFGNTEGSKIRQRDDLEEDDTFTFQPPLKRTKRPIDSTKNLEINFQNSTPIHNQHITLSEFGTIQQKFQEPQAGPSGVKSRKLLLPNVNINHRFNGHTDNVDKDSDSGESTSGYSSMPRIGSKEQVSEVEKNSTPNKKPPNNRSIFNSTLTNERSLFTERAPGQQLNTSLSSRRPSFNVSAFGSPNFMDRTLSTKRIVNSPFYSGRTSYGGASAYSKNLIKTPESTNSSLRNFVQAKPLNESIDGPTVALSRTAKRILSTLEQYTSPSEDVKKIPNPSSKRNRPEGLISKYTGANPYLVRDKRVPSNKELQVPNAADLLKMKLKEKLQDSTVSVREMASKTKHPLNTEEYKLRTAEEPATTKNTNKMKTKVATTRQKVVEPSETVETVKLPAVQLPISTLPSFDFTIPSPFVSTEKKTTKDIKSSPVVEKPKKDNVKIKFQVTEIKDKNAMEYIFSKPLVLAENLKSIKAINNFKFSEPVNKKNIESALKKDSNKLKSFDINSASLKRIAPKNNGETSVVSAAKELMSGSVMDILGKKDNLLDKFKPQEGTWECSSCMIRNVQDKKKCIACETPRKMQHEVAPIVPCAAPMLPTNIGFKTPIDSELANKFKMSAGQWECSACMVRNDANKTKCVACETPSKITTASKPAVGFGNQFKLSSDKWECSACLVRNNASDNKCVACTTAKPGASVPIVTNSFHDKFKPSSKTWECSTCLIRNDQDKTKCAACETLKPGSTVTKAAFKNENQWECESCMVRNVASKLTCVCCDAAKPGTKSIVVKSNTNIPSFVFGVEKSELNGQGFVFGINPNTKTEPKIENSIAPSSIFGESAKLPTNPSSTGFTFGVIPPNGTKSDSAADTKPNEVVKVNQPLKPTQPTGLNITSPPKSLKRSSGDEPSEPTSKKVGLSSTHPFSAVPSSLNGDIKSNEAKSNKAEKLPTNNTNLFTFGAKTDTESSATIFGNKTDIGAAAFTFNATPQTSTEKPTFNSAIAKTTSIPISATVNTTSIASNSSTTKPEFTFTSPNKGDSGLFTFGSAKPSNSSIFNSSNAQSTADANKLNGMFKSPTNTLNTTGFTAAPAAGAGSFSFSSPAPQSGGFNFAGNDKSVPQSSLFSAPTTQAPTFCSTASSTSSFGSAPNTNTFGTQPSNTSTFGVSTATPTFGTTNPPAYGATNTSNNPPAYGATTGSTLFGTPTSATTTFGAPTPTPAAFSAPSFGTPAAGTFGAAAQPASNGMFNFGSGVNSNTPKTGFNFGASAPAPSLGFGNNNTQNAPGGFNFGSAAPPAFNAEIKPTFNFTAGSTPNAFTAQPHTGENKPPPQRVIRRALRRTQR